MKVISLEELLFCNGIVFCTNAFCALVRTCFSVGPDSLCVLLSYYFALPHKITQSPTFTIPFTQISEVINTRKDQTIRIESSDCEVITLERRLDEHMIWNSTIIEVSTGSY